MTQVRIEMIRTPESSSIEAIGYSEKGGQLFVRFKAGKVYSYFSVPAKRYADFCDADSKGMFFAKHIKPFFKARDLTGSHEVAFIDSEGKDPIPPPRMVLNPVVDLRWGW